MENHERIPLLARLQISYVCGKCCQRISLGQFYEGIDKLIESGYKMDGDKMICPECVGKEEHTEK